MTPSSPTPGERDALRPLYRAHAQGTDKLDAEPPPMAPARPLPELAGPF